MATDLRRGKAKLIIELTNGRRIVEHFTSGMVHCLAQVQERCRDIALHGYLDEIECEYILPHQIERMTFFRYIDPPAEKQ